MLRRFAFGSLLIVFVVGSVTTIDTRERRQPFVGAGAALTHATAYLLQTAEHQQVADQLIESMFGPTVGCSEVDPHMPNCSGGGFSVVRLPIGTSDFAVTEFYSLDDVPSGDEDWNLDKFSIEKDESYFIPALKRVMNAAQKAGRKLFLVAAPWSAPAWLKTSGTLLGGDLRRDDSRVNPTVARYLFKYIEAYQTFHNITIDAITMQNEPMNQQSSYPTMMLYPDQEADIVVHLDKLLSRAGQSTPAVWLWDHNWNDRWYPADVFANISSQQISIPARVAGTTFHCYEGDVTEQSAVRAASPSGHNDVFFTECSATFPTTNFAGDLVWDATNLITGATQNWARTVLKWNLVLNSTGGPKIEGGCMTCRGIITFDQASLTFDRNEDFYAVSHLSAFVERGDIALLTHDAPNNVKTTAFVSPDGDVLRVIAVNPKRNVSTVDLVIAVGSGSVSLNVTVPPMSVATVRGRLLSDCVAWRSCNFALWITEGDGAARLSRQPDIPAIIH